MGNEPITLRFLGEITFDALYGAIRHIEAKFGRPVQALRVSPNINRRLLELPIANMTLTSLNILGLPVYELHHLKDNEFMVEFVGGSVKAESVELK